MPAPRRYLETFSFGAGYDIAGWTANGAGGGGSQNPDFTSPAWLQSPNPQCLQIVSIAGNGAANGPSYTYNLLTANQNHDTVLLKCGIDSESLGDGQAVGALYLYDPTVTIILALGQWVQLAGVVVLQVYGYGNGSAVQIGSDIAATVQTPIRLMFRVDIDSANNGLRVNDGTEIVQPITNGTRQITQLGLVVLGTTSNATPTSQPLTQLHAYMQVGDLGPIITRRRAGMSIMPALAPVISMFGSLWARSTQGLYLHKEIPQITLPLAA